MSKHSESTPNCLYCGNNPVHHRLAWGTQTLSVVSLPLARLGSLFNRPFVTRTAQAILTPYTILFQAIGLLKFSKDVSGACSERSQVIWEEANRRGIFMEQFILYTKPIEQYRAHVNGSWRYFNSLPIPPWENTTAYTWIDDKALLKRVLEKAGVPVPRGGRARTERQALEIFGRVDKPVIAKPEVGSRGRHTATHLYTEEDLKHGFKVAQQLCHFVVIEEHLIGSVYRGTYVNGEVVGILRGDPPRITGNGISKVAELIRKKNATKHREVHDFVVRDTTHEFLARQGYTLESVLPDGKTIDLTEKIGLSYGGYAVEEIPKTHPKILAYLKKAGDVLRAPLIGFDFIIPDITKDPDEQKWGIIEANSLPFINLHHFPVEGEPVNVAAKVWDMWKRG